MNKRERGLFKQLMGFSIYKSTYMCTCMSTHSWKCTPENHKEIGAEWHFGAIWNNYKSSIRSWRDCFKNVFQSCIFHGLTFCWQEILIFLDIIWLFISVLHSLPFPPHMLVCRLSVCLSSQPSVTFIYFSPFITYLYINQTGVIKYKISENMGY